MSQAFLRRRTPCTNGDPKTGTVEEDTLLKNRVIVEIAHQNYTLLVEEDEEHVRRVAALVDEEISKISEAGGVSDTQSAVLCALNLAERLLQAEQTAEHLRTQLKDYLDDVQKARAEAAEARRELSRMKNQR